MASRTPHAQPEPAQRQALEQLSEGEAVHGPRAHLRIERRACRLLDLDNFAGGCKALIDCLKEAGFLADDDPGSVEITFAQVRVRTRQEEGTAIRLGLAAEDPAPLTPS
ncbi:MAG: hypothetical protein R3F13_13175 [Prosthecobacter sp.]